MATRNPMNEPERYMHIDAAALALGVGTKRAYQLANQDNWRKTGGKPARYNLTDIRATRDRRKTQTTPDTKDDPALAVDASDPILSSLSGSLDIASEPD
jgi:hypothetical protein